MSHFSDAIETLKLASIRRGVHYSLDRFVTPLDRLGNPHLMLPPVIHVAGTNGKGSTTTFIAAALRAHGYSVGTYTSPHIRCYRERICIDGQPISEDMFLECFHRVVVEMPIAQWSEFELLTLLSFLYFNLNRPDFIIYETGLGGRLDATNVVRPIASVITPIGMDHSDILGATIDAIASEKAGIIKPGIPVFTAQQTSEVAEILMSVATQNNTVMTVVEPWNNIPDRYRMSAKYQRQNAALADSVVRWALGGRYDSSVAQSGMAGAQIWGRFNQWRLGRQLITVDGAHNIHGFIALKNEEITPDTVWLGMLTTKSAADCVRQLPQTVSCLTIFCPDPDRWHSINYFQSIWKGTVNLWNDVTRMPSFGNELLITGSLYFIAALKPYFDTLNQ